MALKEELELSRHQELRNEAAKVQGLVHHHTDSLPLLPPAAVWMRSVPTGCGALVGWTGLALSAVSVIGVLRGAGALRDLVLVGLLLMLGFVRRKAVACARCPYCRADRRVKRRWPGPWTCCTCRQPIES